jgi:hypothetical protein
MSLVPPSEDLLKKMISLGLVRIVDGNYTHSLEFEKAIFTLREHPPNKWQQLKMANRLNSEIVPFLLNYGIVLMKKGEDVNNAKVLGNIATAFFGLELYFKNTKLPYDSKDMPNFIYTIYYLNLHRIPVGSDSK